MYIYWTCTPDMNNYCIIFTVSRLVIGGIYKYLQEKMKVSNQLYIY